MEDDERDENEAIARMVERRLPAADSELGSPLYETARELGFDPDQIFAFEDVAAELSSRSKPADPSQRESAL